MSSITQVKCIWPFIKFTVHHHGYCYSCCGSWTKIGDVGRLSAADNSIMKIWNNERMQYIRKAILEDKLWKVCNFKYCPLAKNEYLELETMKNDDHHFNHIIDQIMSGKTIMDKPPYIFEVASSGKCNLKCIMCTTNDNCLSYDEELIETQIFNQIIPEILPNMSKLSLTANGEVFFNPYSRRFLQSLDATQYPSLQIQLLTNGTLLTPKFWESIRHNRYESISVSIDAATKETYEKIRKNGNWDVLRRNLEFIGELRRQNIFSHFSINFCVMKSNYKEMKGFTELGLNLGCDKIYFQTIVGLANVAENINFINNKRIFVEISRILADPIFCRPEVDTIQIEEYRKYQGKTVFFWDDLMAKGKEWISYFPVRGIYSLAKYFPFILDFGMRLKKKRIPVEN